jgi:hypothetical protein
MQIYLQNERRPIYRKEHCDFAGFRGSKRVDLLLAVQLVHYRNDTLISKPPFCRVLIKSRQLTVDLRVPYASTFLFHYLSSIFLFLRAPSEESLE